MGYIAHDAVLVTASDYTEQPDVDAFRQSLPEKWRPLVIGPVKSAVNGYLHYAFLPDGSKEGWSESEHGDEYRQRFADLFSAGYEDGSSPFDVVKVRYGGDEYDHASAEPVLCGVGAMTAAEGEHMDREEVIAALAKASGVPHAVLDAP